MRALLDGTESAGQVADWAMEYVIFDDPQIYPEVDDRVVWDALTLLSVADVLAAPNQPLYGPADFEEWLCELREAGTEPSN